MSNSSRAFAHSILAILSLAGVSLFTARAFAEEPINLSDFTYGMGDWFVEAKNGAEAESQIIEADGGSALQLQIVNPGSEIWDVQLIRSKLGATKGQHYTVTFEGMAEGGLYIWCQLQEDGGKYTTIGRGVGVGLESDWKEFILDFTTENLTSEMVKARLIFGNLGVAGRTILIKNVKWVTSE